VIVIDRHSRQIAVKALRDFVDGAISNKEYERRYPQSRDDPALREVYIQIWFLYSDVQTHFLTGKHAPNEERSLFLERCILFLKSDLEFQWPLQECHLWCGLLRLFGIRRIVARGKNEEMPIGDKEVWPFLNKTQYEQVREGRFQ